MLCPDANMPSPPGPLSRSQERGKTHHSMHHPSKKGGLLPSSTFPQKIGGGLSPAVVKSVR